MAIDPRADYATQIALIQQRAGDRNLTLDDLDPSRRNVRTVALMAVERMKQNLLVKPLDVDVDSGTWINEDLSGTKDSANVTFTISNTPNLATLVIAWQNAFVTRVSGAPAAGEYSISSSTITLGTAPDAGDSLWAVYQVA